MELAFGYWITAIKIRGLKDAEVFYLYNYKFSYETDYDGLVFKA